MELELLLLYVEDGSLLHSNWSFRSVSYLTLRNPRLLLYNSFKFEGIFGDHVAYHEAVLVEALKACKR